MAPRGCLVVVLFFSVLLTCAQKFPLQAREVKKVVDSLAMQLSRYYVDRSAGDRMAGVLRANLKAGRYNSVSNPHTLAAMLTSDVNGAHHDAHFHVDYNPQLSREVAGEVDDVPAMVHARLEAERLKNFGFRKAEVLTGNIGYLEISSFSRLNERSRMAALFAMRFLRNVDALVIDLRYGAGGSPEMLNLVLSQFVTARIHFLDVDIRSEKLHIPCFTEPDSLSRFTAMPVMVLTSYRTFSAAEGLAYSLQQLHRARIVGERTRGGAHTVTYRPLGQGFVADIPFGEVMSALSGKNWEGTGVQPDVLCAASDALNRAAQLLLADGAAQSKDSVAAAKMRWYSRFFVSPPPADSTMLRKLAGRYGAFAVTWRNGTLWYEKSGKASVQLEPLSERSFRPRGSDGFIVSFRVDASGRGKTIDTEYDDSRIETSDRTE